jgi:hypothetical protein
MRGGVEELLSDAFGQAEKAVTERADLSNSGTTASVAFQRGNHLWLAAAGDSRALLCGLAPDGRYRCQPLSLDHRPGRPSETARWVRAAAPAPPAPLHARPPALQPRHDPAARRVYLASARQRPSQTPAMGA